MVFHEAPHKLRATLGDLRDTFGPDRKVALCRELTKLHEETRRTTLGEAADYYRDHDPKGEYVLVVAGCPPRETAALTAEEAVEQVLRLVDQGARLKDAAREVAEQVSQLAAAQRGRALPLKVSGAFHSPWMEEAGRGLAAYLADMTLSQPSLPLYANATAQPYGQDGRQAAGLLARQVYSPVRWQDTLERMAQAGVDTFVEVGAGTTLSGLVRKTLPQAAVYNVSDPQSLEQAWEGIVHGA